jgi:hypothetical protein
LDFIAMKQCARGAECPHKHTSADQWKAHQEAKKKA